jgi:hypothetical protein
MKQEQPNDAFFNVYNLGKPAGRLAWSIGSINYKNPPSDNDFHIENGKKFLRSSAYERMKSHEKDRSPLFYKTIYNNVKHCIIEDGDNDIFLWETPLGNLRGKRHNNHFDEYPIKTAEDLDIWNYIFQNITYEKNEEWFTSHNLQFLQNFSMNWSPVQQLLQFDTGLENFYYFLMDAPEKMQTLLQTMQSRCLDRLELGLSCLEKGFPFCVYWGENTSSSSISPEYYRKLTLPHIKEYARLVHEKGGRLVVHMCGLLRNLLDCFAETGMDGIHSATPPPFGDAPYSLIREKFKPDFTIMGRFNAQLWVDKNKSEIQANLKKQITEELIQTPFLLMVTDDALNNISYDNVMTLYEACETLKW